MTKKILFTIILFLPLLSISQNIKGIVFSSNGEPLKDVNIFATLNKVGTKTNQNGEFALNLKTKLQNEEVLEFSHVGYTTSRVSITYLTRQNFKIHLEESIENLSAVVVISTLKLKPKLEYNVLKKLKYPVFAFGSFIKDDKIYVMGGNPFPEIDWLEKLRSERADFTLTDYLAQSQYTMDKQHYKRNLSVYDIKTNTWTTPISKLKSKGRAYHNIHYYNNSIYVLGGKKIYVNIRTTWEYLQDQIEVVDIDSLSSKIDFTNPHQAANFASFTYKDNIIALGGSVSSTEDGKKVFTNKVHLYDITSGYWHELPDMPTAKETTGILINDKIYLIGGDNGKLLSDIETFDLTTGKWQIEGQVFSELERPAVAYHDNMIYFFEDRKMYTYDLKSTVLKEYEIDIELKYSAMYYDNNKLYLLGGRFENSYSKIPSSRLVSIDLDEFKKARPNKTKILSQGSVVAKAN